MILTSEIQQAVSQRIFLERIYFYFCLYVFCVLVGVYKSTRCVQVPVEAKGGHWIPGAELEGATGGCELPGVGVGTQTQVRGTYFENSSSLSR